MVIGKSCVIRNHRSVSNICRLFLGGTLDKIPISFLVPMEKDLGQIWNCGQL